MAKAFEMTVRVRVVKSFVATHFDQKFRGSDGQELDMPSSADWIKAGLVVPLGPAAKSAAPVRESASLAPAETAAAPEAQSHVMGTAALHQPGAAPKKSGRTKKAS